MASDDENIDEDSDLGILLGIVGDDDNHVSLIGDTGDESDIFYDPFFDFEEYLKDNVPDDAFLPLVYLFRSCWLDPHFTMNRCCNIIPDNYYLPEEIGLIYEIRKILKITLNDSFSHEVLTCFCVVTGRNTKLLQFDSVFKEDAKNVRCAYPAFLKSLPGQGPCAITPYLLTRCMFYKLAPLQLVAELYIDDQKKETTSNIMKIWDFANQPCPEPSPLQFEELPQITLRIHRFQIPNGGYWVQINYGDFSIAYGDDCTNGKGNPKYKWVNDFNGICPPTLQYLDRPPIVNWIDKSIYSRDEDGFITNETKELLPQQCPIHNPTGYKEVIKKRFENEMDHFTRLPHFIWYDPETQRISENDLQRLVDDSGCVVVIECNEECPCHGQCQYCQTNKGANPNLKMFYSPEKDWCVCATNDIEAGTLITVYTGRLILEKDVKNREFFFAVEYDDDATQYGYDARENCNIGRFINQACVEDTEEGNPFSQPNTVPLNVFTKFHQTTQIGYFAKRKIFAGEELTVSYGNYYKMDRECMCTKCLREKNTTPSEE